MRERWVESRSGSSRLFYHLDFEGFHSPLETTGSNPSIKSSLQRKNTLLPAVDWHEKQEETYIEGAWVQQTNATDKKRKITCVIHGVHNRMQQCQHIGGEKKKKTT